MNGFTLKAAFATFVLLLAAFLTSSAFATNTITNKNEKNVLDTKLGCMACHQRGSMHTAITLKKQPRHLKSSLSDKKRTE